MRRTMRGITSFLRQWGRVEDCGGKPFDSATLDAALAKASDGKTHPNLIVCNGFQKRKITAFNQSGRKYEPESSVLRNLVDVYESNHGVHRVILSRWVPAQSVLILESEKIQVMPLGGRSFFVKPLAEPGDFRKAQIIGEYTLEIGNGAHWLIDNLATS